MSSRSALLIHLDRQRIVLVQNPHDQHIDRAADKAAERICDQVHRVAAATFHKKLVEFVRAPVGESKEHHNYNLEPRLQRPLAASPPHAKASCKRRVFACMGKLVPYMRQPLKSSAVIDESLKIIAMQRIAGTFLKKGYFWNSDSNMGANLA